MKKKTSTKSKSKGKSKAGKVWVPGHHRSNGPGKKKSFIDGHWRKKSTTRKRKKRR